MSSILQPHRWLQLPCLPIGNSVTLPPDIVLVLDAPSPARCKFFAHRFVLAQHSGYFRTLFASAYNGSEVHVPSVQPSIFAALLTYMYTGQLEVNAENVYDLLFACDRLYTLPIADLCKRYLREQRFESVRTTSVIKPVPRRNTAPLSTSPTHVAETLKYQPLRLHEDDDVPSIFKPVGTNVTTLAEPQPSTTSSSTTTITTSDKLSYDDDHHHHKDEKKILECDVVYDIACCDGPIKLHKVVNQFYKPWKSNCDPMSSSGCKLVFKGYRRLCKNSAHHAVQPKAADHCQQTFTPNKDDLQCYSCKSCGSKFPSYYFVNKHRKLHHANEDAAKDQP